MADEGITTPPVTTPEQNMESSFGQWNPGAQPPQDPPKEEPRVETPPAGDDNPGDGPPADPPRKEWYQEFGEFKDSDEFKGHYNALKAEHGQLGAKLKEFEGKPLSYSSDAIGRMDAYARKLVEEGVTDPKEIQKKVLAMFNESTADYMDIARTNPAEIIGRSIREKYSALGASEQDIARAVKRETQLPPKPSVADYADDQDPEYISAMEAYQDAESDLRLKAMGIATEMEGKREKFDFQPKGVPTKEEREKMINEAAARYNARIPLLEAEIPRIEIAGHKVDFPLEGEYVASINEAIQNPAAFIDQFYTETGEPDVVAIGRMKATLAAIPMLIERAVKQKVHEMTEKQDADLRNPDKRPTPQNGGGSPNTNWEDSFKQHAKERMAS